MKTKSTFPKLSGKALLSPMAGVTDIAFRQLARSYGAGLTYTEFVSSAGIIRKNDKTLKMIKLAPNEKPSAVQLFGSNEEEIVNSAKLLEKKFDIIDINCGCPAYKVIKIGAGSELLKNPENIAKIVNKVASAINKPVTIKIRIGIDEKHINAVEIAKLAEDAGAAAITVHGRTQKQGYSGEADWNIIKKVKESVNIPVIGNGDVNSPEIFKERLDESGVDYIMIGRAAMGNPALFKQIDTFMKRNSYEEVDKITQFFDYLKLAEKYDFEFTHLKNQAMSYTKGIEDGAKLRKKISFCKTLGKLKKVMDKSR